MKNKNQSHEVSDNDRYGDLSEDIQKRFLDIVAKTSMPFQISYTFINDVKLKTLIKIAKANPVTNYLTGSSVVVYINSEFYDKIDDEDIDILFDQAICSIFVDTNTGKVKIIKPDVYTFSGIINKYGLDKVGKANKLVDLINDQQEDEASDAEKVPKIGFNITKKDMEHWN